MGPLQRLQVQPFHYLHAITRQMAFGQLLLRRRWQEIVDVAVNQPEVAHRRNPRIAMALLCQGYNPRVLESPTGC